jgi:adenosine deaminase
MLAELHLHLYGCIDSVDLLEFLAGQDAVVWDNYLERMRAVYGAAPPVRDVIDRHRDGDASAAAEFAELFVFGDADAGDFDRFSAKFQLLVAGSCFDDPRSSAEQIGAEVRHFARGIREGHRRGGVSYAETRVMLGRDLQSPADRAAIDALLDAYAESGHGVTERLAISLHRADPWAGWERLQELVLGPRGELITGIDFCHVEEGHPPKDKAEFFAAVADFNRAHPDRALAILYHVGESFRDKSLESAVRWVHEAAELGAHRLGHAIALGIDPAVFGVHDRSETVAERRDLLRYDLLHQSGLRAHGVVVDSREVDDELRRLATLSPSARIDIHYDDTKLAEVRARQDYAMRCIRQTSAVVEVCPTSNRRIGGITDAAHHPVHRFLDAGLPVVVSSDDPGIFGTTLEAELQWVCDNYDPESTELRDVLVRTAWESRSELLSGRHL